MPYKKKFQKEKRKLGDELEVRVGKGEISEGQAKEIMAAWNRDMVRFNECGDKPDVVVVLDVRRRVLKVGGDVITVSGVLKVGG